MKLFISWSEEQIGLPVAQSLAEMLSRIVPGLQPWLSDTIPVGAVGVQVLLEQLRTSDGGLVVLTPYSQISPWVLFESGAFAVKRCLYPYRVGLPGTGLRPPFDQIQHKRATEPDTLQLIVSIDAKAADIQGRPPESAEALAQAFTAHWPELKAVTDRAAQDARQYLTRYAQYGAGGVLATIAERKAAEAQERAEAQELRAEAFRSLLFGILRYEDHLAEPGVLKNLKIEMAGYRKIAEAEAFDDYAEGQMYEGEIIGEHGVDVNQ